MAPRKKVDAEVEVQVEEDNTKDITKDLIKTLNREMGTRVAYNLGSDFEAPTNIKYWISTQCAVLDYTLSNRSLGGLPGGRVIEIAGPPSCGKSHIAYQCAAQTQKMGGLVVYIDTENATPIEKLHEMGIDVKNKFVYVDEHCTENVFKIVETVVNKAKALTAANKNIPILVIWDSVANTSPQAELNGEYTDNSMALQARTIAKGMRKIVGFLGDNNVTFLCINQLKASMNMMGDPWTTPGGKAIPFAASIQLRITSSKYIKDAKSGAVIGITVKANTKKNKITYPGRTIEFNIMFGRGTDDTDTVHNEIWTKCKKNGPINISGNSCSLSGESAWKDFTVVNSETGEVIIEKKYQKANFKNMLKDEVHGPILYSMLDKVMTYDFSSIVDTDCVAEESDE